MRIKNPVFIIGCFRGGTSLLFRLLSESPELWSLYRESNHMWRRYHMHPNEHADIVCLDESDASNPDSDRKFFENHFHYSAYNSYILGFLGRVRKLRNVLTPLFDLMNCGVYLFKKLFLRDYRIIDKTPPNCYRVSYLAKVFPDAKFIYLTRSGKTNTSSLMNAWRDHKRFPFQYRKYLNDEIKLDIAGYDGNVWKFANPPGWQAYVKKSLAEICAFQWADAHEHALKAFNKMDSNRYIQLKYEDLIAEPDDHMRKICKFIGIKYNKKLQKIVEDMPLVNTSSKPSKDKEERNKAELESIMPMIQTMQRQLGYFD